MAPAGAQRPRPPDRSRRGGRYPALSGGRRQDGARLSPLRPASASRCQTPHTQRGPHSSRTVSHKRDHTDSQTLPTPGGAHLENLVPGANPAVLEGVPLRVEAAHEHRHARAVLVAGQRQAQPVAALLQLNQQHLARKVAVFLLDFLCRCEIKVSLSRLQMRQISLGVS